MAQLPDRFLRTMQAILGTEYDAFIRAFEHEREFGLRVNTSKISKEEFERIAPFHLKPIPWIPNGYFYEEEDYPARHPFYAAGLYYLQEPSAMTPASRLPIEPGDVVLDLCAAPGGKATALGAELQGQGFIVANDINNARAKALLRNMELFGISNTFITNEPPHVLAEKLPEFFDKIMVDAPCSGEGMFRKNPAVVDAWLEKGPEYFSAIQKDIIINAADMLKPGGMMFYSTCTFSPLENENTITHLLRDRPEMEVVPMEEYEGFSEGLLSYEEEMDPLTFDPSCQLTRRIFPHKMSGEGHYMALLRKKRPGFSQISMNDADVHNVSSMENNVESQKLEFKESNAELQKLESMESNAELQKLESMESKSESQNARSIKFKAVSQSLEVMTKQVKSKSSKKWWQEVRSLTKEQIQSLEEFFTHVSIEFDPQRIDVRADKIYYVPSRTYEGERIRFLRNGVYLGDLKKKRFEPSQPFALALRPGQFDQVLNFKEDDPRLDRYMRGETLDVADMTQTNVYKCIGKETRKETENEGNRKKKFKNKQGQSCGWYLVEVEGYPLGFGKLAKNTLKNKYPAGWRKNS